MRVGGGDRCQQPPQAAPVAVLVVAVLVVAVLVVAVLVVAVLVVAVLVVAPHRHLLADRGRSKPKVPG